MTSTFKSAPVTPDFTSVEVLKVSRYDQIASWLIALLVSFGTVTGALLLIWWGSTIRYQPPIFKVKMEGYGRGQHPQGVGRDEKGPGDSELPQLEEPAGSELFDQLEPTLAMACGRGFGRHDC